ncbi:tail protein X [uncultured Dialister sp.]|jgi:phage tail protein X|uniref:tail protein X n=1 Tax=uncultured Dialister sp. TaxID=278064 RepID=UPI00265D000A|nr:tail protein X [uncultured Dialister sp.]
MSSKYRTVQGDMWDSIAKNCYGSELGMNALIEANHRYIDIVVFPAGIELTVPDYSKPETSNFPPWRR